MRTITNEHLASSSTGGRALVQPGGLIDWKTLDWKTLCKPARRIIASVYYVARAFTWTVAGTIAILFFNLRVKEAHSCGMHFHETVASVVRRFFSLNKNWQVEWSGLENIDRDEQYIIVANHQSLIDPLLLYLLPVPFRVIAKKWVFMLPFVGWALKLGGNIPLEHHRSFLLLREDLQEGFSLALFPEGTRSSDGALQRFRSGAFHLSAQSGLKILPVVIVGSRDLLPKYHKILAASANIRVNVLKPVDPAEISLPPGTSHDALAHLLLERVHGLMAEKLDQLR